MPTAKKKAYKAYLGKEVEFGIRPEHLTERRPHTKTSDFADLDVKVEVVEPMGMDSMVYFSIKNAERVCGELAELGVLMLPVGPDRIRAVTHLGIDAGDVDEALKAVSQVATS